MDTDCVPKGTGRVCVIKDSMVRTVRSATRLFCVIPMESAKQMDRVCVMSSGQVLRVSLVSLFHSLCVLNSCS